MSTYGMHGIPLEAQYLYWRGMELSEQKKGEEAVTCFRQAITIAPRFTGAYVELSCCLARLGRVEDAMRCYRRLDTICSIMERSST